MANSHDAQCQARWLNHAPGLVDATPQCSMVPGGTTMHFKPASKETGHYNEQPYSVEAASSFLHPDDRRRLHNTFSLILKNHIPCQLRLRTMDVGFAFEAYHATLEAVRCPTACGHHCQLALAHKTPDHDPHQRSIRI
jgi:hypothetical protein